MGANQQESAALESEITESAESLTGRINAWLASLEGNEYLVAEVDAEIERIRRIVGRAGHELFYTDLPVALSAENEAKRKHARLTVESIRTKGSQKIFRGIKMPLLSARVIPNEAFEVQRRER